VPAPIDVPEEFVTFSVRPPLAQADVIPPTLTDAMLLPLSVFVNVNALV
jgi:hypothetical protein